MRGGERTGGRLNRRTCAQQSTHTCEGRGWWPLVISLVGRRRMCADCTRATRRSQWGVGVRKVRIDRLLTRVTCAFLGTLDPGYTHGNRPHVPPIFSLSPLSPCPPLLFRASTLFVPLLERANEGVHLLPHGGSRRSSKGIRRLNILTLCALSLSIFLYSKILQNTKSLENIEGDLKNSRKRGSL